MLVRFYFIYSSCILSTNIWYFIIKSL